MALGGVSIGRADTSIKAQGGISCLDRQTSVQHWPTLQRSTAQLVRIPQLGKNARDEQPVQAQAELVRSTVVVSVVN